MGYARSRHGFTLIELLVVILIITILAGFIIAGVGYARALARKADAEARLGTIEAAIESFRDVNGYYPQDDDQDDDDPVANSAALATDLASVDADNFGPDTKHVENGRVIDTWGFVIRYQHFSDYPVSGPRTDRNPDSYQLWSIGPDGEDQQGGGDDLDNWSD